MSLCLRSAATTGWLRHPAAGGICELCLATIWRHRLTSAARIADAVSDPSMSRWRHDYLRPGARTLPAAGHSMSPGGKGAGCIEVCRPAPRTDFVGGLRRPHGQCRHFAPDCMDRIACADCWLQGLLQLRIFLHLLNGRAHSMHCLDTLMLMLPRAACRRRSGVGNSTGRVAGERARGSSSPRVCLNYAPKAAFESDGTRRLRGAHKTFACAALSASNDVPKAHDGRQRPVGALLRVEAKPPIRSSLRRPSCCRQACREANSSTSLSPGPVGEPLPRTPDSRMRVRRLRRSAAPQRLA